METAAARHQKAAPREVGAVHPAAAVSLHVVDGQQLSELRDQGRDTKACLVLAKGLSNDNLRLCLIKPKRTTKMGPYIIPVTIPINGVAVEELK